MPEVQRTTVYLDKKVYRALKIMAAANDCGISQLVNDAVEETLREEALEREAFRKTRKEKSTPFSKVLRELKRDGLL